MRKMFGSRAYSIAVGVQFPVEHLLFSDYTVLVLTQYFKISTRDLKQEFIEAVPFSVGQGSLLLHMDKPTSVPVCKRPQTERPSTIHTLCESTNVCTRITCYKYAFVGRYSNFERWSWRWLFSLLFWISNCRMVLTHGTRVVALVQED